jgi:ethanolamine utilization protein EutJ
LVIAGAQDISFEAAEVMKVNPDEQARLFPIVRPVMEKVGDIVARHVAESQVQVESLTLVGGTSAFARMAEVVEEYTGLPTYIPDRPVFVTPLGIAMNDAMSGDGA